MSDTRKFFLRMAAFLAVVIAGQVVIARVVAPLPEKQRLDASLRVGDRIVAFGDSENWNVAAADADRRNQVEMLEQEIGAAVGNLGHPGYHLGIYEAELKYLARSPARPETVIVPVQLRSFSPEWDMRPTNQFEREVFVLDPANRFIADFYTPLAILRGVETVSVPYTEFLGTPVYRGTQPVGVVNDFEAVNKLKEATEENVRNDFVYKYMGAIDPGHRKLASLDALLAAAEEAGIKVYVYIPPIDHQTGTALLGAEFKKQVAANAALVCGFLEERGERCLDLSFALGADAFDYPSYPNEHLNEKGRRAVAERLADFFFAP